MIEEFDNKILVVESVLNRLLDRGEYSQEETVVILLNYVIDLVQRKEGGEMMEILANLPEYYLQSLNYVLNKEPDWLEADNCMD